MAEIPVDAVIPVLIFFFLRYLINLFNKKVLPVPAEPVRNIFCPDLLQKPIIKF